MTHVTPSRRAVIGALLISPAAYAAVGPAIASPLSSNTSKWRETMHSFRAELISWNNATEAFCRADEASQRFPDPRPTKPPSASDGLDMLDMTLREIKNLPTDKAAWAAYEQDMQAWHEAQSAWDAAQMGDANKLWNAAHDSLRQAVNRVVQCRVDNLADLSEKLTLGLEIFGQGDDSIGDPDELPAFLALITDDTATLAARVVA